MKPCVVCGREFDYPRPVCCVECYERIGRDYGKNAISEVGTGVLSNEREAGFVACGFESEHAAYCVALKKLSPPCPQCSLFHI
jgi:hypothetical protein